jgi:hypothetical protein
MGSFCRGRGLGLSKCSGRYGFGGGGGGLFSSSEAAASLPLTSIPFSFVVLDSPFSAAELSSQFILNFVTLYVIKSFSSIETKFLIVLLKIKTHVYRSTYLGFDARMFLVNLAKTGCSGGFSCNSGSVYSLLT